MIPPTLHDIVIFVHVLAATVLLGSSLFFPLTRWAIRSAQTGKELEAWLDYARRAHRANPLAALVLLATGVYLGSTGWWHEGWFYVSIALFVVDSVLAAKVIDPAGQKLGMAVSGAHGALSPEADALRWARTWDYAPDALLASDLAVLYIMLAKPSLAGAIALVAGCFLLLFGYRVRARRLSVRLRSSHALVATAPVGAGTLVVVLVVAAACLACSPPSQQQLRAEGAKTYARYCAGCHGEVVNADDASTMEGSGPAAAAGFDLSTAGNEADVKDAILSGRGDDMPPFRRTLSDRQLRGLMVFLAASVAPATLAEGVRRACHGRDIPVQPIGA